MSSIESKRHEDIEELRRAMGTLPSERPPLRTSKTLIEDSLDVKMVDGPRNPYKAIFESAAATWGDDQYDLKWPKVSPENRFQVCQAALTGQTLPQALEVCSFLFQVKGSPRWLFEEHAREINQFITFLSVGCRDNNKLDASMHFDVHGGSDPLPEEVVRDCWPNNPELVGEAGYFDLAKENYRMILEEGEESWQSARCVLPMAYHHPYLFYTSYLSIMMNTKKYRKGPRSFLCMLLELIGHAIGEEYPLLQKAIDVDITAMPYEEVTNEIDRKYFEGE